MTTDFSPLSSFLGGGLIGLAILLMRATHGRTAGVSEIFARWLTSGGQCTNTNTAFLCGVLLGLPTATILSSAQPPIQIDSPFTVMLIAGLFVGYGAVSGNGCTSDPRAHHGPFGLFRLPTGSMVATATCLAASFITTFFVRHVF